MLAMPLAAAAAAAPLLICCRAFSPFFAIFRHAAFSPLLRVAAIAAADAFRLSCRRKMMPLIRCHAAMPYDAADISPRRYAAATR